MSPEQVDRLFAAPRQADRCWLRDRALLELLYATGCRASELSNLRLRDVHLDERLLPCRGKGDKQRIVPLGGRAVEAVDAYLRARAARWLAPSVAARRVAVALVARRRACGASGFGNW